MRKSLGANGVGRVAIYRRWESLTDLIVAALDHGRVDLPLSKDGDFEHQVRLLSLGQGPRSEVSIPRRGSAVASRLASVIAKSSRPTGVATAGGVGLCLLRHYRTQSR